MVVEGSTERRRGSQRYHEAVHIAVGAVHSLQALVFPSRGMGIGGTRGQLPRSDSRLGGGQEHATRLSFSNHCVG